MCYCVCVCSRIRDNKRSRSLVSPSFTNTCIILPGSKGPVSLYVLCFDTSQTSEERVNSLMIPLLKARTCLYGMMDCNLSVKDLILPFFTLVDEASPIFASPLIVCSILCYPHSFHFFFLTHVAFSLVFYLSTRCPQCVPLSCPPFL